MLCSHKLWNMMFFILSISIFIIFPIEINYEIHDKKFLTIVNVFEEWHHLLARVQYEIIIYFEQKKFIIFHDHSCFESTSSLIGIVIISILVCHHILSSTLRNQMCYPIIHTSQLKRAMKPMNNNAISSSSPNTFDFKHC